MWMDTSVSDVGRLQDSDTDSIEGIRESIVECDRELIDILRRRVDLVRRIGALKARQGLPVTDPQQEATVVRRAAELARAAGLDEELIRNLLWQIMSAARSQQYSPPDPPSGDTKEKAPGG